MFTWYAGTVNTALQNFNGQYIDRNQTDTGLYLSNLSYIQFTNVGWYAVNAEQVIKGTNAQQIAAADISATTVNTSGLINPAYLKEGVGTGFFYGPGGGGASYDPSSGATKVPIDQTGLAASPSSACPARKKRTRRFRG